MSADCIGSGQRIAFAPAFLLERCPECGHEVTVTMRDDAIYLAAHRSSKAEGRRSRERALEAAQRAAHAGR